MIGKKTEKAIIDQIISLRMSGLSLRAICKGLKLPKSTVSSYISGIRKNNLLQSVTNGQVVRTIWQKRRAQVVAEAEREWLTVKHNSQMMLFLGLYWGEGCKASKSIGVTNNDPNIIKVCYDILVKMSPGKKIRVYVYCYPSHNKNICRRFWINLLGISNVIINDAKEQRSVPLKFIHPRCLYGRCSIRYGHFELYWRIMTWIKLISEN